MAIRYKTRLCRMYMLALVVIFGFRFLLGGVTLISQSNSLSDFASGVWNSTLAPMNDSSRTVRRSTDTTGSHLLPACRQIQRPDRDKVQFRHDYWQRHVEKGSELLLYSAYYDDRPYAGVVPWIRILGVSTEFKEAYCQLWYPDEPHPCTSKVIVHKSGRGDKYNKQHYNQLLLSCKLDRAFPVPSHVSVVVEQCSNSSIYLPIEVPNRSEWTHEFGICVAIAFGNINEDQVIEWTELALKFGVSEINIYNSTISSKHDKLFRYYSSQGAIRVHQMPPPVPLFDKKGAKFGSPASLNDCMLRYMYRYRYILVLDFDEVIVPRRHTNYTNLLKAVDEEKRQTKNWQSYTFRNVFYFQDFPKDPTAPQHLDTIAYRKRVEPSGYLFAPKSFVNPRRCLSVFNHYCYIRFPESPSPFTVDVPTALAASHHYKTCNLGAKNCNELMAKNSTDDIMMGYKDFLINRTQHVRNLLHLQ